MELKSRLRMHIKAARKRRARWVVAIDVGRLLVSADGRSQLWTRLTRGAAVHQTSTQTGDDRYPELFDLLARVMPSAARILSFGCSSGEELIALRRRFASAEIVGVEINSRSRRIAARRVVGDALSTVVTPDEIEGTFDIVLALAVLQREPHKIAEMEVQDLTQFYAFELFDAAVSELTQRLRPGGLLCVANAHYRVEDSRAAASLRAIEDAPSYAGDLFGPDGLKLSDGNAATVFNKLAPGGQGGGRDGAG